MTRDLQDWVLLSLKNPGEKHSLSIIARYPAQLNDAFKEMDMNQPLDWSRLPYGIPGIVEHIIQTQKYDIKPENVLPVTGGTTMCIYLACTVLLKPGDEVICETPGWPQVGHLCKKMEIKVNGWPLRSTNQWQPNLDDLKKLINPRTKLIYINHPHNPTGTVLSVKETIELCNIASKYGTYILSDEIYRGLEWESDELSPSIVNHYDRGITVSSLTKTCGVTGIRFGWFATRDKQLYQDMYDLVYNSILCNNIMSERIAEKLLEPTTYHRLFSEGKTTGRENLKLLKEMVQRNKGWSMRSPDGSYISFVKYGMKEPSWDFCLRMLNRKPIGLRLIPGICFGDDCESHLRIGFADRPTPFKAALHLLEEGAQEAKG